MEYLPEKKRTQKIQIQKKETKIRDFREYLAKNDVVLSMVKCKLYFDSKNITLPFRHPCTLKCSAMAR